VFAASAALLASGPALAQNDKVTRGPKPAWAFSPEPLANPADINGLIFVRYNESVVRLDEKGQTNHLAYRFKLLHPNALQLGNLQIVWNPAAGAPMVHQIWVHRDGSAIDVLAKTSFEVLRREDKLEAAMLDGQLTASLRVPDLRVGDELEVALTLPGGDPTLKDRSGGLLALAPEPAAGRFGMSLVWADGQEPQIKVAPELAASVVRRADGISLWLDNPPPLAAPKDAPPRYSWQRVIEYSDFRDWPSLSRHFAPLYRAAATIKPGSPLKAEARKIAAAHASPADRAAAALKLVQQDVRYIYVGLDGGNLMPANAEETWARRYGDCKGKTSLLLALLAELGIAAEPVLASNALGGDGFDQRLPSPSLFDHVLVRAFIDEKAYFLDGTLPAVATPSSQPLLPYRSVLPVTEQGSALAMLPWISPATPDELTLFDIDATKGFDEPARITSTMIVRGAKGLQEYLQYSSLTPAQMLSGWQQNAIGGMWQAIDKVDWRYDPATRASITTVSGIGQAGSEDDGEGKRSLILPGGGFSPPDRRARPSGQNQTAPFLNETDFTCRVTTVRLPASTRPAQWSWNSAFVQPMFGRTYYRAFDLSQGSLRMIRGLRTEQLEIDAATAARDNTRLPKFDNSMAVLRFDPRGAATARAGGNPVPTATDIDWAAATVPCMPEPAKAPS
jgi:transglutaminase-like putative cysteine protease